MGSKRTKRTANHTLKRGTNLEAKSKKQPQELPESGETKALINADTYKRLYAGMLKCRMVGERACALLGRQKAANSCKRAIGQEATAVGTAVVLRPEDGIAPTDRSFVAQIVAGAPVKTIFKQLLSAGANVNSAPRRRANAPLPYVTPAATTQTQVAVATGLALAHKNNNKSEVVLAISGEEWSESDELRATLEFAARNRLPIIYVVNSDETADDFQSRNERLETMVRTCGVTVITVDGSDAVAVYRVASESISRARKGVGPTLIDCRFLSSPVAGNSRRTSPRQKHVDPLVHMENYMRKRDAWSDSWKQALVKQFTREVESAVKFAERASAKKTSLKRRANG